MQIKERLPKETSREYAYRMLKNNIINLELEPGSLVSENALAAELGVSRTPIREALIELSKIQIVEVYPQKGSRVTKVDYNLVEEAIFLRLTLEKAVVELACDEANESTLSKLRENVKLQEFYLQNELPDKVLELDNEFHRDIFILANKLQTYNLMNSMMTHFDRVRTMSLKTVKNIKIVEDHQIILEAIEHHDKEGASLAMEKHLSRFRFEEDILKNHAPEFFK